MCLTIAPPDRRRLGALLLLVSLALAILAPSPADADDWYVRQEEASRWKPTTRGEVRAVLVERARHHGADPEVVVAIADCESSLRPWVTGDSGSSHGLIQLSDLRGTGLLHHFLAVGYTDAYDAEQAADYIARVFAGEWRGDGVTPGRWSCYWNVGGR